MSGVVDLTTSVSSYYHIHDLLFLLQIYHLTHQNKFFLFTKKKDYFKDEHYQIKMTYNVYKC